MTFTSIHRRRHAPWLLCLPLWLGCSPDEYDRSDPEQVGELGAGTFRYRCVGDTDPYCNDAMTVAQFPERIAVGGHFGLEFTPHDPQRAGGLYPIVAAGPAASRQLDAFRFERAGLVAFLALDALGEVLDLRHLYGAEVDRVAVLHDSVELLRISVEPGAETTLEAVPKDLLGSTLAGSLSYQWSVADPAIAELVSAPHGRSFTLRGLRAGETALHVMVGALVQQYTVRVGAPDVTTGGDTSETAGDGDSSGGDASGDASTDAGTRGEDSTGSEEVSTGSDAGTGSEDATGAEDSTGGIEQ